MLYYTAARVCIRVLLGACNMMFCVRFVAFFPFFSPFVFFFFLLRYNGVAATVVERLPSGGKFKVQLESGTTITVKADNIEP